MSGAGYLVVKNFERFQHYKNRNPPWIKFYASILFDYEFQTLPDKSKAHLMLIWLLISQRHDHRIPNDARWVAQRIGATEKVDLQILIDSGWLISLADCYQPSINGASKPLEQSRGETEERRVEAEAEGIAPAAAANGNSGEHFSAQDLADGWNEHCVAAGYARVERLSTERREKAAKRLREQPDKEFWERVFGSLKVSPLLRGLIPARNPGQRPFKADFDWLIGNSNNCVKIYEGKYDQ